MSPQNSQTGAASHSRRDFIKSSSLLLAGGAVVGGSLNVARGAHAFGSDTIKIALVGCGGRGTGAADQMLNTNGAKKGEVKLVAVGDVFPNKIQGALRGLGKHGAAADVPKDRQFDGFDNYKKVLATDADVVILATPPGFRPLHFAAAVAAGKNVFMEKPVASDVPGIRQVLAAGEESKKKGLLVQVGLQRRHEGRYKDTVKALQDGIIGDIILARAYWNGTTPWKKKRAAGQSELEYQMTNWYYFNWICGDHIVEQHIHNLDVINWVMGGPPVWGQGQGGCQVRNEEDTGETFDHHFVELKYKNGAYCYSQCRHIPGCWNSVSEHVHGTKGYADVSGRIYDHSGKVLQDFSKNGGDGHQQEQTDLIADLRAGNAPNEAEYGALSTMTAIFGRMLTYSGQAISWDDAMKSEQALADFGSFNSLQDEAPVNPKSEGVYARPLPGITDVLGAGKKPGNGKKKNG